MSYKHDKKKNCATIVMKDLSSHKCKSRFFLLIQREDKDEELNIQNLELDQDQEESPLISLHATVGETNNKTLRKIQNWKSRT